MEIDLIGLAATTEFLGVGQGQQAEGPQGAEGVLGETALTFEGVSTMRFTASRSKASTRGASSLRHTSRVISMSARDSSDGISLVAAMAREY